MSKRVTFYLGPAVNLSNRRLTITRMARAGDDSLPLNPQVNNLLAGTAENVTQTLPDDTIWEAKLVDTRSSGEESDPDYLRFNTGSLQFPGKKSGDRLAILSMEDMSSSSSLSSSSLSSSSSSSISTSSISTSSSSISTSSSSISTSSSSISSQSTSSSSSSQSSSSSSSLSSSSSST